MYSYTCANPKSAKVIRIGEIRAGIIASQL